MAVSYERGDGVAQNVATAVNLYLRACESGLTLACDRIGVTYEPPAVVASAGSADGFSRYGWVVDTETEVDRRTTLWKEILTKEAGAV